MTCPWSTGGFGSSYLTHKDSNGHTGTVVSLDKEDASRASQKDKVQGRSSTKNEITVVCGGFPSMLSTKCFIKVRNSRSAMTSFTKTRKVLSSWKQSSTFQAQNEQNTLEHTVSTLKTVQVVN